MITHFDIRCRRICVSISLYQGDSHLLIFVIARQCMHNNVVWLVYNIDLCIIIDMVISVIIGLDNDGERFHKCKKHCPITKSCNISFIK